MMVMILDGRQLSRSGPLNEDLQLGSIGRQTRDQDKVLVDSISFQPGPHSRHSLLNKRPRRRRAAILRVRERSGSLYAFLCPGQDRVSIV
jgi:hypothetical protein